MADVAYQGDKRDNLRHGVGTYTYKNRFFTYSGEWVRGKKHGSCKLSMADGSCLREFKDGEITGRGCERSRTESLPAASLKTVNETARHLHIFQRGKVGVGKEI